MILGWSTWRRIGQIMAGLTLLYALVPAPAAAQTYQWNLPRGFPTPKVPTNNPITKEKIELGRFLFYDKRLSGNQTQSCASCHQQALAFTDGMAHGVGSTGQMHPRGSMSLTNVTYAATLAWANPLLRRIEDQVLLPLFGENPVELGLAGREDELLQRLNDDARYRDLFSKAFPQDADPISVANVARGLASFVRTLISGNSPYDRYVFGIDDNAITPSAVHGAELFFSERLECFHCHGGFNFSVSVDHQGQVFDEASFQNNGLYNIGGVGNYPPDNTGIKEITGRQEDMGFFKAPTLRNIELTAPYMHDGSIATLEEVLDHYAAGGRTITEGPYAGDGSESPFKSQFMVGFNLTEQEKEDVLNFLKSLTDTGFTTNPAFSDPFLNETPTPTPTMGIPGECSGDCDASGEVTINELVRGVNIVLGHFELTTCPEFDTDDNGVLTIDELVKGVNSLLAGCQ